MIPWQFLPESITHDLLALIPDGTTVHQPSKVKRQTTTCTPGSKSQYCEKPVSESTDITLPVVLGVVYVSSYRHLPCFLPLTTSISAFLSSSQSSSSFGCTVVMFVISATRTLETSMARLTLACPMLSSHVPRANDSRVKNLNPKYLKPTTKLHRRTAGPEVFHSTWAALTSFLAVFMTPAVPFIRFPAQYTTKIRIAPSP